MNGRTHKAAALACSITAASFLMPESLTLPDLLLGSAAAITAASLPDCDQYEHNVKGVGKALSYLALVSISSQWILKQEIDWKYMVIYMVAVILGALSEHRSATHSFAALIGFTLLFGQIIARNICLIFWFFVSYASHLLFDFLNKKGEMLFWPVCKKRYCLHLVKSESKFGDILFVVSLAWYILVLLIHLLANFGISIF